MAFFYLYDLQYVAHLQAPLELDWDNYKKIACCLTDDWHSAIYEELSNDLGRLDCFSERHGIGRITLSEESIRQGCLTLEPMEYEWICQCLAHVPEWVQKNIIDRANKLRETGTPPPDEAD